MNDLKQSIIADLHHILYGLTLQSDNDNWDLRVAMAKCIINQHNVYFKDDSDVKGAEYWQNGTDASEHFFMTAAPGIVPTVTEFELMCENYMDWQMWSDVQAVKPIDQALDLFGALGKILRPEPTGNYEVTMLVSPVKKVA